MFRARLAAPLTFTLVACAPAAGHDLERLCGTWESLGADGTRTEERWWPHAGGLRGESRTFDHAGEVVAREDLTLAVDGGVTVYHAEPAGAVPTDFREVADPALAVAGDERVWIWQNLAHDFPRRIVYRTGGDRLSATISDPDGDEFKRRGITWDYRRIAACAR